MKYKCIDPGEHKARLTKGKIYDGWPVDVDGLAMLEITCDDGVCIVYSNRRFEEVK